MLRPPLFVIRENTLVFFSHIFACCIAAIDCTFIYAFVHACIFLTIAVFTYWLILSCTIQITSSFPHVLVGGISAASIAD